MRAGRKAPSDGTQCSSAWRIDEAGLIAAVQTQGGETMAIVEVSVVPVGTATPSVSQYVAAAVRVLQQQGEIEYETTAMGTILDGDLDKILAVVRVMHEVPFGAGISRVLTTIRIDDRRDKAQGMKDKVASVTKRLQG